MYVVVATTASVSVQTQLTALPGHVAAQAGAPGITVFVQAAPAVIVGQEQFVDGSGWVHRFPLMSPATNLNGDSDINIPIQSAFVIRLPAVLFTFLMCVYAFILPFFCLVR